MFLFYFYERFFDMLQTYEFHKSLWFAQLEKQLSIVLLSPHVCEG